MIKVLLIDCCGDCKYFNLLIMKCWHSEAPIHNELDTMDMPLWCPLQDYHEMTENIKLMDQHTKEAIAENAIVGERKEK